MSGTLTLKDVARRIGRPESTVRNWRDTFEEYIPAQGTGRGRRYPMEAVAVFEQIAEAYAKGLSREAVETQLNATYGKTFDIDVTDERGETKRNTTTTPQAVELGQAFFVALNAMETQRREIDELRQALAESAAATEQAERIAQQAIENAVTAKEAAVKAKEDALREARREAEEREQELKAWIEARLPESVVKRRRLVDRVKKMLGKD